MYNQVTDRFGIVQTEIVKAPPFLGRTISAVDGYSIEVFRRDVHLGSIRILNAGDTNNIKQEFLRMKVSDGDTLFSTTAPVRVKMW